MVSKSQMLTGAVGGVEEMRRMRKTEDWEDFWKSQSRVKCSCLWRVWLGRKRGKNNIPELGGGGGGGL